MGSESLCTDVCKFAEFKTKRTLHFGEVNFYTQIDYNYLRNSNNVF